VAKRITSSPATPTPVRAKAVRGKALGARPAVKKRLATTAETTADPSAFDVETMLASSCGRLKVQTYRKGQTVFSQGDAASHVCYLQEGSVKLSVLSRIGKEAVVAMLSPRDFFGEGALTGQGVRMGSATAVAPSKVAVIDVDVMVTLMHDEPTFAARFLSHMLARNIRIEADLVDQLFNSSERRLARTLLLLARYGQVNPQRQIPKISQETLADMIGTTRSRVNFFMNKFRKLGLIEYNGTMKINAALLSVVLHD